MRRTNSIDIQTFHSFDILFNLFRSNGTPIDRGEIMSVHAMKYHTLTINKESAIISYVYFTESNLASTDINSLTIFILKNKNEIIEIRSFSTPFLRICHIHIEAQF